MTKKEGSFDKDSIRELAALLDETGLTEIEIEHEGKRVRVRAERSPCRASLIFRRCQPARKCARAEADRAAVDEEFIVHPGTVYLADGRHRLPLAGAGRAALRRDRQRTSPSGRLSSSSKP